ncbi:MAG: DUF4838 domain-containing protein, partial [Kiritimatiellia bacterium]
MTVSSSKLTMSALIISAGMMCFAGAQAEKGLILHWGFDDVQGQAVKDLSGNGNDGRIEGEVGWIPGVSGKAMLFDGDFGSVWCDDNAMLNPSNMTVMFWLSPKSWGLANTLIDKGWAKGWGIDPHYRGASVYYCANIGKQRKDTRANYELPLNQWTHIAVTHDGQQTAIYVNGVKKNEAKSVGGLDSSNNKLRLGGMTEAVCYVDELKLYNRALEHETIKASFEAAGAVGSGKVDDAILERLPGTKPLCENLTVNRIPLVKENSANGVIVLDAKAPKITEAAVKELSRYLKKMFGVEMPVVRSDERTTHEAPELKGRNLILVGESKIAQACGFTAASLKPDGFMIGSKENVLVIVGNDSAGTSLGSMVSGSAGSLYGVYRFLEALGVRWYFPGMAGELLPTEKAVVVNGLKITDAPYFVYREGYAPPGANVRWMRRIGFGGTVYPASTCHSFGNWYQKYGAVHPEWFALRADGGRAPNLCVSNPEAREQIVKQAREFFQKKDVEMYPDFTILENDGAPPPCACPECKRKLTPEQGWGGTTSDYWAEIAVKTADALREEFPDRRIVIGAYNQQTRPPVRIKELPPNVSVQIQKLRLHIWSDGSRKTNYDEILGGWLALKPASVSFWEYYGYDCWGGGKWFGLPGLATEIISDDIKTLKRISEKSGIPFLGEMIFTNGRPGPDTP